MDQQTFNTLYHFTERLTRDPDDRIELVLMAWQQSLRSKRNASIPIMINFMKLRARELKKRCAFGAKECGKSIRDVWHYKLTYLGGLNDTLATYSNNPLSMCVVNDFQESLDPLESDVTDAIVSGYNATEISKRLNLSRDRLMKTKMQIETKAVKYLR
jgi:hypothetical protein